MGGIIIHSLLPIGDINNPQSLADTTRCRLERALKDVHFLFFDEMSMIDLRLLSIIDSRLREVRPQFRDLPFGGLSIILFGDFAQLPPVADKPLYSPVTDSSPSSILAAHRLYRTSFIIIFHLIQ